MKKTILILLAAFLALASCEKAPVQKEGNASVYTLDELSFDFTVEREDATKGIRSAWQSGDRLFLFFEAVSGRKLPPEKEGIVHLIGFVLLMILMIAVLFNDIGRFFR